MSWFMFKEATEVKPRGIKVEGFPQMHRPRLNLSWGVNEKETRLQYDSHIMPSTIVQNEKQDKDRRSNENIKVLTQTSDDEDQLMKLIRQKKEEEGKPYSSKNRSQSLNNVEYQFTNKPNKQSTTKDTEFSKRMRYLQNSLLPNCKRDTMGSILDHDLSKQVPLSQSRLSNKSNKKNQSSVVLGIGYNSFSPPVQPKKDLMQQLQEMYEYEDRCRRRIANSHFSLG